MVPVLSSCADGRQKGSPNGSYSCDWLNWLAMRFDLITIFPEFFAGPFDHGILRRAREAGLVEVNVQDLRVFTKDRHRTVDDRPFGGGEGMVLKPEPLFEAVESLLGHGVGDAARKTARDPKTAIVLLSAGENCSIRRPRDATRSWSASFSFADGLKALMSAWPSICLQKKFRLGTSF